MISLWYFISVIVLFCIAIPFIVQQARYAVYPQLEKSFSSSRNFGWEPKKEKASPQESIIAEMDMNQAAAPVARPGKINQLKAKTKIEKHI